MSTEPFYHQIYIFKISSSTSNLMLGTEQEVAHNGIREEYVEILEDAVIPSSVDDKVVDVIGYRSFQKLPKLRSVFIPKTIRLINGVTFSECPLLSSVIFEDDSKLE